MTWIIRLILTIRYVSKFIIKLKWLSLRAGFWINIIRQYFGINWY